MRIRNFTPHNVVLFVGEGQEQYVLTFTSQGVARVAANETLVESLPVAIDDCYKTFKVDFFETTYGKVEGLPEPEEGTLLIVSALVLSAAKAEGRKDCIAPNTGKTAVRNDAGQIVGVKSFVK